MFLLLLLIVYLFLRRTDRRSLAYYFSLIILISLIGNLFVKANYYVSTSDILHCIWILVVFACLILPWRGYAGIQEITCLNHNRVKKVSIVLVVFLMVLLVGCSVLAYYTITLVDDINRFKYVDGPTEFYYSLGISVRPFMLATYFYPLSYLMVPLHFYFLSKGEKKMSFWCFLASLVSIAYGLTYFSRAHLIHYILIYVASYWLLRDTITPKDKKLIKKVILIGSIALLSYFVVISSIRFVDHDYSTRNDTYISDNSMINSMFDYLVMWWNNSEVLFSRFKWSTLNGQMALQDVNRFLSLVGINIGASGQDLMHARELVLGEYAGSFIGAGGYFLYDFGPFFAFIILLVYASFVNKLKPQGGVITINRLLTISVLSLLPIFAIFYSLLNVVLILLLLLIPIQFFINIKNG